MGKGKGGKNAFDRFLEESYFAFWFRQWAAFFIVIGVILIIVGAVVGSLYPKSKQTSFAESQLVTSSESAQYSSWSSKVETVSYEFLAVDPSNLTCSLRGPFVFDVTNAKTSVVFENGGSTISYQLTKSKTFRAAESSKDLSPITTLNPSYLHLTKVNGSGQEFPFLLSAYQSSTIDSALEAFFRSTAPILIGARGIAQVFPDSIKTVRQDTIYPAYFGSLNQSLVNYQYAYLNDKVSKNPCSHCVLGANTIYNGVFLSTYGAWSTNPNCRINPNAGLNLNEFKTQLITGFVDITAGACKTYLAAHSFSGPTWSGAGDVAYSILESLRNLDGLNNWFNPTSPATLGYCSTANRNSAATYFNGTRAQIDDVCDRFIKIFYSEMTPVSITAPQELGARYFCIGPAASDAPIIYPSLPTDFTFSGLPLASMTAATYSYSTCLRHIAVLGDVTNFVIPAYESATIPPTYAASLTAQEYSTLRGYLLSLDGNFKRWFVSVWRGDSGPYSCPTCIIRPLGELANKNVFDNSSFAALAPMLFPELNPSQLRSYYALTNPNPKPDLLNPTLFSNITQATGILSRILKLEQATVRGQYGITQAQLDEIEKYASAMLNLYNQKLMADNSLSGSNSEPLGLFQFARAHLACGPSRLTERCSIGAEFFGLTSPAAEFAIASYNPSPTPRYYKSFDNSDSTLRDTVLVQDMSSLFTFLGNKDETHLLQSTDSDPNYQAYRKYFYYLLSTVVRSEAIASSSGALASRSPVEWISGFDDPTVPLFGSTPAFFGFDPNGAGSKLQIKSGIPDISQAYDLVSIDGSSTLNAYPTPIDITKLKNPDAFAPGQISVGDEVKVLDVALSRPFTYTFSNPDENSKIQGVSTNKGTVSSSEWVVSPAYNIVVANLMPIPFAPISRFYSPCSAEFSHACKFPVIENNEDDLFPKDFAIYSDLKTGLVVRSESCVVMSLQVEAPNGVTQPFPITGYGITSATLFSQVRRRSFTQIPAEQADSYLKQFDDVSNTATAILLALIIVGALFVLTGAVFIVFWVIRHGRKSHAKSELDLVEDPFGEKSKNVASFKY